MSIDVEKLQLLRSTAAALGELELSDVNLLLHELGISELPWGAWNDDQYEVTSADRAARVLECIRDLARDRVIELARAVEQLFAARVGVPQPLEPEPLVLFASHLATQRAFVAEVAGHLERLGVRVFVAHDSIEPDAEWHLEIERALRTCHAGVVFLSPGFRDSKWCDQEVGWLLGREVPCYPLKFQGEDPYGPLGKKQAFTVRDDMKAIEVANAIFEWARSKPALARYVDESLVQALRGAPRFATTDYLWRHLKAARDLGDASVASLLVAIRDNAQVYKASGGDEEESGPYAELFFKLAQRQPGFAANQELAREVAKLRSLETLLPDEVTVAANDWNNSPF